MVEVIGGVEWGHLDRDLRHKALLFITFSLPRVFPLPTPGSREKGGLNLNNYVCVCGGALKSLDGVI